MKKILVLSIAVVLLLALSGCQKDEMTEVSDNLSLALPRGLIAFSAQDAAKNEQLGPVLQAVSDGSETLYIGALPASGADKGFGVVYIIQREQEAAAATGVANIGTYADTNEFALGLAQWYKKNYPDSYVVDVLAGKGGVPVFVVHAETRDGIALLGETYSTGYSDSIIACFLDGNGEAVEPSEQQYNAFVSMLKTVAVK